MKRNKWLRQATGIVLAAALTVGLTACGDSSEQSSGANVPMEDLEYGATMRDSDDYAVPLEYDKRYLEDPELKVLADYYAAIQNEDADGCAAVVLDFYLQYLLDNAFGGLLDVDAYVTQQHRNYAENLDGGDFTCSLLQVTDCKRRGEAGTGEDYLKDMLDSIQGEGYCDQHLTDCKTLTVQLTISNGENSYTTEAMPLYVVQMDDEYYVCP